MRFFDAIETVRAPAVVRVAPGTTRSHRNEGDEDVEMWAISRQLGRSDATKVDDFWEASPDARQTAAYWKGEDAPEVHSCERAARSQARQPRPPGCRNQSGVLRAARSAISKVWRGASRNIGPPRQEEDIEVLPRASMRTHIHSEDCPGLARRGL
jgi:hypothetical protein